MPHSAPSRSDDSVAPDWFPVTDPGVDAPDGARLVIEDFGVEYERHGSEWVRVVE